MENIKPDFHAKPICVASYTLIMCRQKNCDHEKWITLKDVLAEREHYQKQIGYLNRQMKLHIETGDRMIKRAEAAEKKAKDFEDAAGAMSAELTEFGERAEKAEARVKELEAELKRERNWSKYETKQVKARDKTIKTLAGEKTK